MKGPFRYTNIPAWLLVFFLLTACGSPPEPPVPPPTPAPSPSPSPTSSPSPSPSTHHTNFKQHAVGLPGYDEVLAISNIPPTTAASIAKGQKVYSARCATCHGINGLGDGPGGMGLTPPPANLTKLSSYHHGSDSKGIYRTAKYGVPNTAMQPWEGLLDEEEFWSLVHYIQTLQQ